MAIPDPSQRTTKCGLGGHGIGAAEHVDEHRNGARLTQECEAGRGLAQQVGTEAGLLDDLVDRIRRVGGLHHAESDRAEAASRIPALKLVHHLHEDLDPFLVLPQSEGDGVGTDRFRVAFLHGGRAQRGAHVGGEHLVVLHQVVAEDAERQGGPGAHRRLGPAVQLVQMRPHRSRLGPGLFTETGAGADLGERDLRETTNLLRAVLRSGDQGIDDLTVEVRVAGGSELAEGHRGPLLHQVVVVGTEARDRVHQVGTDGLTQLLLAGEGLAIQIEETHHGAREVRADDVRATTLVRTLVALVEVLQQEGNLLLTGGRNRGGLRFGVQCRTGCQGDERERHRRGDLDVGRGEGRGVQDAGRLGHDRGAQIGIGSGLTDQGQGIARVGAGTLIDLGVTHGLATRLTIGEQDLLSDDRAVCGVLVLTDARERNHRPVQHAILALAIEGLQEGRQHLAGHERRVGQARRHHLVALSVAEVELVTHGAGTGFTDRTFQVQVGLAVVDPPQFPVRDRVDRNLRLRSHGCTRRARRTCRWGGQRTRTRRARPIRGLARSARTRTGLACATTWPSSTCAGGNDVSRTVERSTRRRRRGIDTVLRECLRGIRKDAEDASCYCCDFVRHGLFSSSSQDRTFAMCSRVGIGVGAAIPWNRFWG